MWTLVCQFPQWLPSLSVLWNRTILMESSCPDFKNQIPGLSRTGNSPVNGKSNSSKLEMATTSDTVRQSRSKNCMARGCIASTACATSMTYSWSFHHSKLYSLRSACTSKQSLYIVFMYCTHVYIRTMAHDDSSHLQAKNNIYHTLLKTKQPQQPSLVTG